jgi:GNAT superfamily N-acetyltransferase
MAEGYRFLFEEILHWVLENWGDRKPVLSSEMTEHQTREIAFLERAGFLLDSTFYTRHFDLALEPGESSPLEPGFTIVDMLAHPDYPAQRLMRADGFSGKTTLDEQELRRQLEFYNYSHEGPIYYPECDLCVMAEDGTFVAGCEALIDARNVEADVERVCTRAAYRRRGFARAVIQECLRRLRHMGLRNAYITGYSPEAIALYGSLGAVDEMTSFVYEMRAS